jgi:hypothetical protein
MNSPNDDIRSRLCEDAVNQLPPHQSMHKAFGEVSDGGVKGKAECKVRYCQNGLTNM